MVTDVETYGVVGEVRMHSKYEPATDTPSKRVRDMEEEEMSVAVTFTSADTTGEHSIERIRAEESPEMFTSPAPLRAMDKPAECDTGITEGFTL